MKNLFLILFVFSFAYSQSDNASITIAGTGYVTQTLTRTIDTADVVISGTNNKRYDYISIVLSSSATDTVTVYTLAKNGTTWTQNSLTDLSTNGNVASAIMTTTAREFIVNNPQPMKIRLLLLGEDGSTVSAIVQGKYGIR
jgi:uncharacterized protein (DUF1800 family)